MPLLELHEDADLFAPNPGGQADFMDDWESRYVALAGGWYAGKTWAGARKLANLHVRNAFSDDGKPTGVKGLIVGQDYSLARTINVPEMQSAFAEMGLACRYVADPKRNCFELPDLGTKTRPSEILIRSADAPEKINGFTVGHAWGDEVARWATCIEDPTRDPLLQLKGRLRDPRARMCQAVFTFTHEGDTTAVYRDFEENPKPEHRLYRAGTFDNPSAKAFGESLVNQLTPELAAQYLDGNAASFRGNAVYGSFGKEDNVTPEIELVNTIPLHLSIDYNISPGMNSVVGQHFPGDDMITARHHIHEPRMDVRRMMIEFKRLIDTMYGGWKWPELHVFGDASGASKWAGSGESCWEIVISYLKNWAIPFRLKVPSSNPPIPDRVNTANCAFRDIEGKRHYVVHPDCKGLIEDYRRLKWDAKGELDKSDRNLSHASDAEGYRIFWVRPIRKLSIPMGYAAVL